MAMLRLVRNTDPGGLSFCSGWCHRALASWGRELPLGTEASLSAKKITVEKVWREFFSDPSMWWDHRTEKENARYPDFKHKTTQESLWLNGNFNPPWVEAELQAMAPGTVQLNIFSWNRWLARYAKAGQYEKTIQLFQEMQQEGLQPDRFTFVPVLKACAGLQALEEGKRIHKQIMQSPCASDMHIGNNLIDMYAKCGSIEAAKSVFDEMPARNVVTWNVMIQGYVKCGQGQKTLELSQQMHREGVDPDPVTFVGVLSACASVKALAQGRWAHQQLIQRHFDSNVVVSSCLVDMYAKCGSIEDARKVFDKMPIRNVVTWSAIILGYVKCGQGHQALELCRQMQQQGLEPDRITFVGFLNACASVADLEEGRRVHKQVTARGYERDLFVGSALVDMYAKCGSIDDAERVFNRMSTHDAVAWTAMILGYVKFGKAQKALDLSQQMQKEAVVPDPLAFVGILNACSSLSALEEGRRVHEQIIQRGCESDISVCSALVDMYGKCGSIEDARRTFEKMPTRDMVSWNAMLGAYAMHGHANEAIIHFEQMSGKPVEMDMITFVSLLSACSHGGAVEEGLHYFGCMSSVYNVFATVEHYACVVDLLCRAGRLHEAEDVIMMMPCEANATVWTALLGACRVHGNAAFGERVAKEVLALDPGNSGGYVLLSNIYAAAGKWESSAEVQRQRLERGVKKEPGCTWIEVNNEVHSFTVDDHDHPQIFQIHAELIRLSGKMKEAGYLPGTGFVLHDVTDDGKEVHLLYHSEKLAIAFGLISTEPGTPLRIFKNLRVCEDCHTATKFIQRYLGEKLLSGMPTAFITLRMVVALAGIIGDIKEAQSGAPVSTADCMFHPTILEPVASDNTLSHVLQWSHKL